jgi:hypothetical protein
MSTLRLAWRTGRGSIPSRNGRACLQIARQNWSFGAFREHARKAMPEPAAEHLVSARGRVAFSRPPGTTLDDRLSRATSYLMISMPLRGYNGESTP